MLSGVCMDCRGRRRSRGRATGEATTHLN
jgi:hypothetical protein